VCERYLSHFRFSFLATLLNRLVQLSLNLKLRWQKHSNIKRSKYGQVRCVRKGEVRRAFRCSCSFFWSVIASSDFCSLFRSFFCGHRKEGALTRIQQ
jgi:hypothetical protein